MTSAKARIPLAAGLVRRFDGPVEVERHAMGHGMGRFVRPALGAVALGAVLSGCGVISLLPIILFGGGDLSYPVTH